MVVAQVAHILNNTGRTFHVKAGDPFYTPQVGGKPCAEGLVEVPPGFDQATEGLVLPWETTPLTPGLVIWEKGKDELLRVIVAPIEAELDKGNQDWLQFRNESWRPLQRYRWMALGRRHFLGAVGGAVALQLTFRDNSGGAAADERISHSSASRGLDFLAFEPVPDSDGSSSEDGDNHRRGDELARMVEFDHALKKAPKNTVFLNVYDLVPGLSNTNAMLCNTVYSTLGFFHAAVEVYGEEWSFFRTPHPDACGICRSITPRCHSVHVYRQSVNSGSTSLKEWEVHYLIRTKLAPSWLGGSYDLVHRNCIHFSDELLLALGVRASPPWVRALHETGATLLRMPWPLSAICGGVKQPIADGDAGGDSSSTADTVAGREGSRGDDAAAAEEGSDGSAAASAAGAPSQERAALEREAQKMLFTSIGAEPF